MLFILSDSITSVTQCLHNVVVRVWNENNPCISRTNYYKILGQYQIVMASFTWQVCVASNMEYYVRFSCQELENNRNCVTYTHTHMHSGYFELGDFNYVSYSHV